MERRIRYSSFSAYFILGVIILYVIGHLINRGVSHMAPLVATEVVRIGPIDTPQTFTGIIIRDERVYHAPRDGQIVYAVGEGERVRSGTRIASIQDAAEVASINRDMQVLDQNAMRVSTMRHDQTDPNVVRLNNHIRGQVDNRAHSFTSHNLSDLYALRDGLNQSITHRNQFIISRGFSAAGDYAREQADLLALLGVHSTNMYARSGGIMSPIVDGLESVFTLSGMESLTREQLNFTPDTIPLFPPQYLEANEPAFKIVGNIWYIAVYIPNELIHDYAVGQTRTIFVENPSIGDFIPMNMRITQLKTYTRDSRVVFRSTRYVMDFMHRRNVNIRTTQTVEEGLKIPNTAVASRDYFVIPISYVHGIIDNSVLRYTGEGNVSIPVTVAEWAGAFAHIRSDTPGLFYGDVLLDGQGGRHTITDVRTVQGIYRANHGFADFRRIYTDEPITDRGGSTLLCPVRNRGSLREFDSIVIDAGLVTDGQMIW
ncbi:MAG: hypothetical protein FWE90_03200 [Defluviitaleaceae bacterium]|nr:hypothetical protein [Defluviitaleaceae bacterium]